MVDWLADTRASYDTVAQSYADQLRDALAERPYLRGALVTFAGLVGAGPVADIGCGPGHVTGHLHSLGVPVRGIDLSPAMVEIARENHPGIRFDVGSMTDLRIDGGLAGVLAWWSLIHVPDDEVPGVLSGFRRVLRDGGVVMVGFHTGDSVHLKTAGYGGHPMKVNVHHRPPERVKDWLTAAGFAVEAELLMEPGQAVVFARRAEACPASRSTVARSVEAVSQEPPTQPTLGRAR